MNMERPKRIYNLRSHKRVSVLTWKGKKGIGEDQNWHHEELLKKKWKEKAIQGAPWTSMRRIEWFTGLPVSIWLSVCPIVLCRLLVFHLLIKLVHILYGVLVWIGMYISLWFCKRNSFMWVMTYLLDLYLLTPRWSIGHRQSRLTHGRSTGCWQ
jgi:hypothetical protein